MSVDELARATGTEADALYRLLRALASVGIFSEAEDRRFGLTPMAALLQSGALRSTARSFNSPWNDRAWMHLLEGLRRGRTPFQEAFGTGFVQWLEANPRDARLLRRANGARAEQYRKAVCRACDFSRFSTLTDLGGGDGTLLTAILHEYPQLRGTLADLASVLPEAGKTLEEAGVGARCTTMAGDFFRSVPAGSDAYLLANVLHDWPDERAGLILENCRRAMGPGSRLLIIEMIVPPGNEPSAAKLLDLEMMVVTGGRERREEEFRSLLGAAGLALDRVLPLDRELFILEADQDLPVQCIQGRVPPLGSVAPFPHIAKAHHVQRNRRGQFQPPLLLHEGRQAAGLEDVLFEQAAVFAQTMLLEGHPRLEGPEPAGQPEMVVAEPG
jgi:hypothetical protein